MNYKRLWQVFVKPNVQNKLYPTNYIPGDAKYQGFIIDFLPKTGAGIKNKLIKPVFKFFSVLIFIAIALAGMFYLGRKPVPVSKSSCKCFVRMPVINT